MGIILSILAKITLYILSVPLIIYAIIRMSIYKYVKIKNIGHNLNEYFYNVALSIDQFGNVLGEYFLNDVMITNKAKLLFGNADHTISYVIAHNQRNNSLTKFGKFWAWFLNIIDKDHLKKSLEINEQ